MPGPDTVTLNQAQRMALSHYFQDNLPMEQAKPWPSVADVKIVIDQGQLYIDGAYLHPDGEWATYPFSD